MIFQPDAIEAIKAHRKTVTRRPITHHPEFGFEQPCRYKVGTSYSLQPGRGQKGVSRLTVTAVRRERLGAITKDDIKREGFVIAEQFWSRWEKLHGKPDKDADVWVITFVAGEHEVGPERPHLLAAKPGALRFSEAVVDGKLKAVIVDVDPHQDYTDDPARGVKGETAALRPQELATLASAARARERERTLGPLRAARDRIAAELANMRAHLEHETDLRRDGDLARSIRDLERRLDVFDRRLAA